MQMLYFIFLSRHLVSQQFSHIDSCCDCRTIQSDFSNGKLSVDSVPAAFREMCQAAILHWWSPNRQRALYTNSLLNYGNQQFQAFAPSQSASAGPETAAADAFWLAPPVLHNLLAVNYPVSALPAGFEVGVQQPSHRRMDGQKRQQPDCASLAYPRLKKSKPGSGRQTSRQYGDPKGRTPHMPELSPKLQQRLATLLVLVSADADLDPSGMKQVSSRWLSLPQWFFLHLKLTYVSYCYNHIHCQERTIASNVALCFLS